jgi:predicted amidohydrolase
MPRSTPAWRLALVSARCPPGDAAANAAEHARWAERAALGGADLILFPECSLTGYRFHRRFALRRGDAPLAAMGALARRLRCHLAAGFIERDGPALYNSCALFGPRGLVGVARKVNLTLRESRFFRPGNSLPVLPAGRLRVGFAICADATFFETIRALALLGADLVLAPHATFLDGRRASWVRWRMERWPLFARDAGCALAGCNQAGLGLPRDFAGGALAVAPDGRPLARLGGPGNAPGLLRVRLDPRALRRRAVPRPRFHAAFFYRPQLLKGAAP